MSARSITSWILVFSGLGCGGLAGAAETSAATIPAADFAKRPRYADVQFAPDGNRFAALQSVGGRANLTVGDLKANRLAQVTSFSRYDVRWYRWISNSRLVMGLGDASKGLAEQRGGGLFAVNFDGSNAKELSPTYESCQGRTRIVCRQMGFVRRVPGSENEIIASANERDANTEDLYRLNTLTGRKTLLTEQNPGKVSDWILDAQGIPRAAVSYDGKVRGETFWFRDSASTAWRKISTASGEERRMRPAAFDSDGSLWIYSNLTSDNFQIYEFDASSGKPGRPIVTHPVADLDRSTFIQPSSRDFKIVGVKIAGDKPETVWFDEPLAKLQALMDASLHQGNVNSFAVLEDGKVSVASASDREPIVYYLYDPAKKQLEEVLRPYDWIKPEQLSVMSVVRYPARDGLEIPAYLTLPQGKPATMLPLVALVHGGPFGVRDHWRFVPDVQFLASRGYAVLQPNFRGSGGYGLRHYTAGIKQWGQSMQDDVTDGVRHLIAQGIVDPARVCIVGGSYGGYAVLMGLIREPDLFKCGIDEAGVSDLFYLSELGNDLYNQRDAAASDAFQNSMVGDPGKDAAMMRANSPRLHADKIKGQLMIVQAMRDLIVPIQHAEGMRDAMRAAGKDVEWVVYPDEAHGFAKFENRVDRYNKIEAFLKKNIGQ